MNNKTNGKEFFIPYQNKNIKYTFITFSGKVIDTEQRSDTHISSHSSGNIRNGRGSIDSSIDSSITVQRDIWLIDEDGHEKHFRFENDLPVRTGQYLHVFSVSSDFIRDGTMQYAIYNSSTKESSFLFDDTEKDLYQYLKTPGVSHITTGWWIISLIGLFFWIIPGLILFFIGDGFSAKKVAVPIFSKFNQEFNTLKQELR